MAKDKRKPKRMRSDKLGDYYHPENTEREAGEKTKRGKAYDKQASRAIKYWDDRARPDPYKPKTRSSPYADAERFSYEAEDKKGRQGEELIRSSDKKRAKLTGEYGKKAKHKQRIKMLKELTYGRKGKLPGKLGTRGVGKVGATGLAALAAAIAEPAVRAGYGAVKKRVKRNQETAHKRRVQSQDKRLMKKYKKSDPKKQAIFKKLMSKKTKITQQR